MGHHWTLRRTGGARGIELGLWPGMPIPRALVERSEIHLDEEGRLIRGRSRGAMWPTPARRLWRAIEGAQLDREAQVLDLLGEHGDLHHRFDLPGLPSDPRSQLIRHRESVDVTLEDVRWWLRLARAMRASIHGAEGAFAAEGFSSTSVDEELWLLGHGLNEGLRSFPPRSAIAVSSAGQRHPGGIIGLPQVGLFSELCRLIHNELIAGLPPPKRACRCCGEPFRPSDPRSLYCDERCEWRYQKRKQRGRLEPAAPLGSDGSA